MNLVIGVDRPALIVKSLRAFCGYSEPEHLGGIFLLNMGPGSRAIIALVDGLLKGVWQTLWEVLKDDVDNENFAIDGSIVKAHQDACRIKKKPRRL